MMAEKLKIITLISIVVIDCLIIGHVYGDEFNDPHVISFQQVQKLRDYTTLVEFQEAPRARSTYNNYRDFRATSSTYMGVPIQHTFEICKNNEADELASLQACNMVSYELYRAGYTVDQLRTIQPPDLYTPYSTCYKFNLIDFGSVEEQLIYCPPTELYISNDDDDEPVLVERFLLGQGNQIINTAFIYHMDESREGRFVSLVAYVENVFIVDSMGIDANDRWQNVRASGIEQHCDETETHYQQYREEKQNSSGKRNKVERALCNMDSTEANYLCSMVAVYKSSTDVKCAQYTEEAIYTIRADTSGYIPYKCKQRKSGYYDGRTQHFFDEKTVYCPSQIIRIDSGGGREYWGCDGFFLSADLPGIRQLFIHNYTLQTLRDKKLIEAIDIKMCITWNKIVLLDSN